MALILDLKAAIREFVRDGDTVAMEGFTHLIPSAAGHEIIRQRRRDLTLVRMTPDLIYDQLIGMGCARKLVFSWGGNPGVGSLHRLRDAIEHGWPRPLEIEEHSHAGMATAYAAGASNLPFGVLRGYLGSDLPKYNPRIKFIECPFTGERLAAVPAIRPDVAVIHAQQADRKGNVLLWGIVGVQKEVVMAARRSIVTVEEIVERLEPRRELRGAARMGGQRRMRSAGRRVSVLRAGLLSSRQFLLSAVGRNRARAPGLHRLDRAPRAGDRGLRGVSAKPRFGGRQTAASGGQWLSRNTAPTR